MVDYPTRFDRRRELKDQIAKLSDDYRNLQKVAELKRELARLEASLRRDYTRG
jgi:chromosome segregation ATPase